MKKRSISIAGHATSLWIEDEFWNALKDIAREREIALHRLVAEIDLAQAGTVDADQTGNLSSAIRVYVLRHFQAQLD